MVKRISKSEDGFYRVKGQKFKVLEGSRAMVFHGNAYKTSGGLTKDELKKNPKTGKIVSKKKSQTAKKENRLAKHGWTAKKGKFGAIRIGRRTSSKKTRKSK